MAEFGAAGISVSFDPDFGILERFTVTDGARNIAPLHRAPWVGTDEVMPEALDPHLTRLGGDFFCAPFAASDNGSPLHGWPPNSAWTVSACGMMTGGAQLGAQLQRPVRGARLSKTLTLRDSHPFVYQSHDFTGGTGRITASNHANVSVPNGAFIRTSPKRVWETPASAPEPDPTRGRSLLSYPAKSQDPRRFPAVGGPVDLTVYPWGRAHEDVVFGIEAAGRALGWTAITRPAEGDLFLSLRNAHDVPVTTLWHSNGGRDYVPWSGRHFGCLGVEEGAVETHLAFTAPNDLAGRGTLKLHEDTRTRMRHVIGAIDWPGGAPVADITVHEDILRVAGDDGTIREVPIDGAFLRLGDCCEQS